jgi:hypothetical protein
MTFIDIFEWFFQLVDQLVGQTVPGAKLGVNPFTQIDNYDLNPR